MQQLALTERDDRARRRVEDKKAKKRTAVDRSGVIAEENRHYYEGCCIIPQCVSVRGSHGICMFAREVALLQLETDKIKKKYRMSSTEGILRYTLAYI